MFPRLRFFVKLALSALFRSLGVTFLAVVTIGVALAVLATFAVVVDNLRVVADELGTDVELSAYLASSVTPDTARALIPQIVAWEEARDAQYWSTDEAMADFKKSLGKDAVLLEGLPPDVLPASLEVRLAERPWTAEEVRKVAARLEALEGVEDVRYGQEDIERVTALLGFVRIAALVMGAALCFATILIVSNTIRLTVYARRDEIEIMGLVGATGAFVRAPFVLEGTIQGFFGGMVAALGLIGLREILEVGIEKGLQYAYAPIELTFAPLEYAGYLLGAGALLGLVGSLLAVGKFLRV